MEYPVLTKKIMRLTAVHTFYIRKACEENHMHRGQFPILEALKRHGELTQKTLSDKLGISQPAVTMSIKRLMKSGLVEKNVDARDLRAFNVRLTEKGNVIEQRCRVAFAAIDEKMFGGFSDEELKTFSDYLTRFTANLENDGIKNKTIFMFMHPHEEKIL